MTRQALKIFFILLVVVTSVQGQSTQKMYFPNIYFKLNTADYAKMPYTVDSCIKFIVDNIKAKGQPYFIMFRDTLETELLLRRRIKKFKNDLSKFMSADKIQISVNPISWQTTYEQVKNKPPYDTYLPSLGIMLQIIILDYAPPQGATITREPFIKQ